MKPRYETSQIARLRRFGHGCKTFLEVSRCRIYQIINHSHALFEAQRCLGCFEAPCRAACPAGVNVPGFIKRFREDNPVGAAELIYSACPLGAVCGMACPTAMLCEGACVLNHLGQTPIRIGDLQAHITTTAPVTERICSPTKNKRVAIIGAGPSGLGCAIQLRRYGYFVDVFDEKSSPAGLIDWVIPHHRLPHSIVAADVQRMIDADVRFHMDCHINPSDLRKLLDEYDAVFLGIGLTGEGTLDVPGNDAEGVIPALHFLEKARIAAVRNTLAPAVPKRVVVLGGGNVALDAAVVAKRLGAEQVILLYRRSELEMPGWESEYFEATSLGVEFRWLTIVRLVIQSAGQVCGVQIQPMHFVSSGETGRRWVEPDPSQPTYDLPCEMVIPALGQSLDKALVEAFALPVTSNGLLTTATGSLQTRIEKLFSGGEAVSGGATIIQSLKMGMTAGDEIHTWIERQQ